MSETQVTVRFTRDVCYDSEPDLSYLKQDYRAVTDPAERAKCRARDAARLAAFDRGEWHMLGIRAKATIQIKRPGYTTLYDLTSAGLWGIESDSSEEHFKEVYEEECEILRRDLEAMKNLTIV